MAKTKRTRKTKIGRPAGRKPLLNLRVDPSLHRRLEQAAAASGRTISEEAVRLMDYGLQSPSILEQAIKFTFGTDGAWITGWVMDFGHILKTIAPGNPDWCEEPATFDQVKAGLVDYLNAHEPRGEQVPESTEKPNFGRPD
jgi:hypothetical protein